MAEAELRRGLTGAERRRLKPYRAWRELGCEGEWSHQIRRLIVEMLNDERKLGEDRGLGLLRAPESWNIWPRKTVPASGGWKLAPDYVIVEGPGMSSTRADTFGNWIQARSSGS